jgi:phosphoenolpyruvate carboxylase
MALLGKYTKVFIFKPHQTTHNRFDKYLGTITKLLQNLSLTKNKQSCFKQIKEQNRNQKNRKERRRKKRIRCSLG